MALFPTLTWSVALALGNNPTDSAPNYNTDISIYVMGPIDIVTGRSEVASQPDVEVVTIPVWNLDGRFDPDNATGAYWPNLVADKPIKIDAAGSRRFTGFIAYVEPGEDLHDVPTAVITATGILGAMARYELHGQGVRELILAAGASTYWRLGKSDNDMFAVDETGNGHYAQYAGTQRVPATGLIAKDDDPAASLGNAACSIIGRPETGPTGPGFCVLGVFAPSSWPVGSFAYIWTLLSTQAISVQFTTSGHVELHAPNLTTIVSSIGVLGTSTAYIIMVERASDGVTYTLAVQAVGGGGAFVNSGVATGSFTPGAGGLVIGYNQTLSGVVDEWAIWPTSAPDLPSVIYPIMGRMSLGMIGLLVNDAMAAIFAITGMASNRLSLDSGDTFNVRLSTTTAPDIGSTGLDALKKCADTIGATLIGRNDGVLEVRPYRIPAASPTPVATLNDSGASTDIQYDTIELVRTFVDGVTRVASSDGVRTSEVAAGSGILAQRISTDIMLTNVPEQTLDIAMRRARSLSQGKTRATVTIPMGQPGNSRTLALPVGLEDVVSITRHTFWGKTNVYMARVFHRHEVIDHGEWDIEWQTLPYQSIYATYFKVGAASSPGTVLAGGAPTFLAFLSDRYDTDGHVGDPTMPGGSTGSVEMTRGPASGILSIYILAGAVWWGSGASGYVRLSQVLNGVEVAAVTDAFGSGSVSITQWATLVELGAMGNYAEAVATQNSGGSTILPSDVKDDPSGNAEYVGIWGWRAPSDRHAARVTSGSAQSIPNSTNTKVTPLATEVFDQGAIHSTVTNTGRLTAQRAGHWFVGFNGAFSGITGGSRREFHLEKNGTGVFRGRQDVSSAVGIDTAGCVTSVEKMAVNDYIEASVAQTSGGALNLDVVASSSPEFWAVELVGVGARRRRSTGVVVPTAPGLETQVTGFDVADYADTVTYDAATSRLVLTETGIWLAWACVEWPSNTTGYRQMSIARWSPSGLTIVGRETMAAVGDPRGQCVHALFEGAAGEKVQLNLWQSSGGSLTTVAGADHSCAFGLELVSRGG